jgi:FkbM family methyltransferase
MLAVCILLSLLLFVETHEIQISTGQTSTTPSFLYATQTYQKDPNLSDSHVIAILLKSLRQSTFVDVGSDFGWFSLLAASLGHHVYSFEPFRDNLNAFRHLIAVNHFESNITLSNNVVANHGHRGSHICSHDMIGGSFCLTRYDTFTIEECADGSTTVGVTALDAAIPPDIDIGVLRLDCCGCAAAALLGGRGILKSHRPPCAIFFTWNTELVQLYFDPHVQKEMITKAGELLVSVGYALFRVGYNFGKRYIVSINPHVSDFWVRSSVPFDVMAVHQSSRCFHSEEERWKSTKEALFTNVNNS